MPEELKNCPFCDGKAQYLEDIAYTSERGVVWCKKCGCRESETRSKNSAIQFWNTRAPDPRTEELARALESIENGDCCNCRRAPECCNCAARTAQAALEKWREK